MKLLIAGSNSFVGKALGKKAEVIAIDRTAFDCPDCLCVLSNHSPDATIYLSAYGNHYGQNDLLLTKRVNIDNAIKLSENNPFGSKFIYFSSSSAGQNHPTAYAMSKYITERTIKQAREEDDEDFCYVRPSSITGVGDHAHHLIPKLIRSCIKGDWMPFVENATHDWIDVEDVADATLLIAKNGITDYNISTNQKWTNKQVKEMVEDMTKNKANIDIVKSLRSYDSDNWIVDNTELLELGWKPKFTLEQTIKKMVDEALAG